MIKRLEKKFLSVFMALAMVIGLLPTLTLPASATAEDVTFAAGSPEADAFANTSSFQKQISNVTFTFSTGSNDSPQTYYSGDYSDFEYDANESTQTVGACAYSVNAGGSYGYYFTVSVRPGYTFDLTGFKFDVGHIADDPNMCVYYNGMTNYVDFPVSAQDTVITESNLTDFNDVTAVTFKTNEYSLIQGLTIDDVKNAPPVISSASRDSNTQITVGLSKACQSLTKPNDGGFTVTKTGTSTTYSVSSIAQGTDASHVVLTVADMGTAASAGVTVTYTFGGNGSITDAAVNPLFTDSTGQAISAWDTEAPTVSGINRNSPTTETTNAASVTFRVTFSEAVTGVGASDFTAKGTAAGTVSAVSAVDSSTYDVTVSSITGSGTLRLDLNSSGTDIADIGGTAITSGYTGGQTYTIDKTAPTISSASRDSNTQITVGLSKACQSLTKPNDGGFTVAKTGATGTTYAVSATEAGAGNTVVLTVDDMGAAAGAGVTVTYTAGTNGTIADAAGNALATDSTGQAISAWDTEAPTVSSINRNSPTTETTNAASVTFRVTFSEAVTGVATSDFTLTGTDTTTGTVSAVSAVDSSTYDVTVSSITGSGTLRLDLKASGTDIADIGGTAIATGYTSGQTYTIDKTAPTISSASRDSDTQITVTLSEACQSLTKPNDGGFTVTKTGASGTTYAVSAIAAGAGNTVVLTVDDMGTAASAGVKVTYAAGTNGTIADATGNALATDSTGKAIAAWLSSGGGGNSSGSGSGNNGVAVIVNGESKTAGTAQTTTSSSGQTTTTVTVDTSKLENILASQGAGATVTIPVTGGSDVAAGTLTGAMVKNMESKDATLVVQTDSGSYTLPASEINIDAVSQQLGTSVSLSDIAVTVIIAEPSASMIQVVENAAQDGGFTIMVPAVDYTITCAHGSQTVNVSSFNAYVERTIAIPDGVDPTKITTGVVVDPNETTHHVPTKVTVINGKYYAVINSLTNSTYSVIWNPVEFSDVTNHWAKSAINDMGSRMVVNGVGNNNYAPDRNMTRAEFAAIMIRALGLEAGTGASGFADVASTDWCCGYIKTAAAYGIIKGYDNGNFGPNDTITREQLMAMIARAMVITKLDAGLTDVETSQLLSKFSDEAFVSDYAKKSIAACLKTGIISGTSETTISPQANITRAEVAVMVERLLQKSGLI